MSRMARTRILTFVESPEESKYIYIESKSTKLLVYVPIVLIYVHNESTSYLQLISGANHTTYIVSSVVIENSFKKKLLRTKSCNDCLFS